jgi:hypothetical protein
MNDNDDDDDIIDDDHDHDILIFIIQSFIGVQTNGYNLLTGKQIHSKYKKLTQKYKIN